MARHRFVGSRVTPRAASGSPAPWASAVVRGAGGAGGGPGQQQQQEQRRPSVRAPPPRRPSHRCAAIAQPGRWGRSWGAAGAGRDRAATKHAPRAAAQRPHRARRPRASLCASSRQPRSLPSPPA